MYFNICLNLSSKIPLKPYRHEQAEPAQVGAISKAQISKRTSKCQSIEGLGLFDFFEKSLTMPKKLKGEPSGIFQHPFCRKSPRMLEGGPSGDIFFEKMSHNAAKTRMWDPLVSPGIVLHGKKETFGSVPWANRYILATP